MPNSDSKPKDTTGWLVLKRRAGESIMIGDDIEVAVDFAAIDLIKVAIKAPRELRIDRKEIRERMIRGKP